MVDKIYNLKNKILQHVEKEAAEKGVDRIDHELIDAIKDLAEAEKCCWEAQYYRSVTEAMGNSSGYSHDMSMQNTNGRQGYQMQDSSGYGRSMGYDEKVREISEVFKSLSPEDKVIMKNKLFSAIG